MITYCIHAYNNKKLNDSQPFVVSTCTFNRKQSIVYSKLVAHFGFDQCNQCWLNYRKSFPLQMTSVHCAHTQPHTHIVFIRPNRRLFHLYCCFKCMKRFASPLGKLLFRFSNVCIDLICPFDNWPNKIDIFQITKKLVSPIFLN